MPGQKNVGSVSVRVVPDTKLFAETLRNELKGIKDLKVKVGVDLDKAAAEAGLKKLANENLKIPAKVDIKQDEIGRTLAKKPIHIPAEVDVDQNELARAVAKLKKVHVPADVDTKKLTSLVSSAFAGIKTQHIPTEVDIDKSSIDRILEPLNRTHKIQVQVEANIDRGLLQAQAENLKLKADFEFEQNAFRKAQADVEAGFKKFDAIKLNPDIDRSRISKGLSDIKSVGSSVFSALGTAGSNAAANISDAFSGLSGAAGPLGALLKVSAIASAIAVGGAAITAAWGAASTAVAAVPAAIGLIGAPLATVLLGMDGIKKAAQTLKPTFDALKASVSATFEKGLLPVFQQLKPALAALTPQINAVATSMVGLAQQTANWVTNAGGLQLIQTAFTNIATAIGNINLVPLVDGFVRLAGNQAALQALTTTINQLGLEIQKIADNPALDQAFKGLEGTLKAVTKGFGDLVNNGIKLFAAAAPGVNQVVESITGFFNRFDWNSLGTSVSGVFSGIAKAIDGISPATITKIETAFQGLSNVFKDPAFQANIQKVADSLPAVINQVGTLTKEFVGFSAEAGKFIQDFDSIDQKFQQTQTSANTWATSVGDDLQGMIDKFDLWSRELGKSLGTMPDTIGANLALAEARAAVGAKRVHDGIVDNVRPIESEVRTSMENLGPVVQTSLAPLAATARTSVQPVVPAVKTGLQGLIPAIQEAAQNAPVTLQNALAGLATGAAAAANKVPPAILTPIEILAQKIPVPARAVGESFGQNASSSILAGLAQASSSVDQGFVPLAGASTTGTQSMVDAVNAVLPGVGTAFQNAFTGLQTLATTAFTDLNAQFTNFGTTLTTFGQAFTALTPQITAFGQVFTTLIPQITQFGAAFTTLNPALLAFGTTFTTLNPALLAFGTTFTTLIPQITAFGLAFTTLNPAILAFGTTLTTLNPALLAFGTTFTTLVPQITAFGVAFTTINPALLAFATSLTTINPAILAFGTTLTTLVPQLIAFGAAFTTLNPQLVAFAAALATITPALTGLTAGLTAAVASLTTFTTALTTATTAVTTFATTVTTAITQAMTQMVQAVTTGGTQMVQAMTTAMTNLTTAVKTGMTNALTAVKTGITAIIAALNAAAAQAQAAGVKLGQGFVNGIKSQESAARAAGAALGQAAVDGMNSVKGINSGSPSKKGIASGENLGGSFSMGIDNMIRSVVSSASRLGAAASDALGSEFDQAFLSSNGISNIGTFLQTAVLASVGDISTAPSGDVNILVQSVLDGKVLDERWQKLNDADKADLLLKLSAA